MRVVGGVATRGCGGIPHLVYLNCTLEDFAGSGVWGVQIPGGWGWVWGGVKE